MASLTPRPVAALAAAALLAACSGPFDADVRSIGRGFDTTADVAAAETVQRPKADDRGIISYPNFQVAIARRGDTVADVAGRIGVDADALARFNGLPRGVPLRSGETLVLPERVAEPSAATGGRGVDVAAVAGAAIDRAEGRRPPGGVETTTLEPAAPAPAASAAPAAGPEPKRHKVQAGETVFSIARAYDVTPVALADWNGLGQDLSLREGQVLLIPVTVAAPPARPATAAPGTGSATPVPPSASKPLPLEDPAPAPEAAPPSPEMAGEKTDDSALAMPVAGSVIRDYEKGRNEGIDIAAAAGSPVKAAEAGTVAAITRDTEQVPIVVIRHGDGLLTVYAGVDGVAVEKGETVRRGQAIARVRAGEPAFLHFEVRDGFESVDPMSYLN